MKTIIYYLFLIPVFIFFLFFIIPSWYVINERIIAKNNQMNIVFENWLHVKSEVAFFLLGDSIGGYDHLAGGRRVIDAVIAFEESFERILLNERNFRIIERRNIFVRYYRGILMGEWNNVQLGLIKILSHGQGEGLSLYSKELYDMIHENPLFEKTLKNIIFYITYYQEEEYRNSIILVLFLYVVTIVFYIIFVRGKFLIKKAKTSELEMKEMSKFLMKTREVERKKIALDIHDVLIQKLKEIKTDVESVEKDILPEIYNNIDRSIFEVIQIARNISFVLRPVEVDGNLLTSVKYYCAEIAWRNNILINERVSGFSDVVLNKDLETNIFRIVQEALANIVRHAKANIAEVIILYSHPLIFITITDNGIGIPEEVLEKLEKNKIDVEHMGLQGIKDRVKLFDGIFSIKSDSSGTIIRIKIPNK